MKSPDEEWWTLCAAEYVLGTLRGRDLALFEHALAHDNQLQQDVLQWETLLSPLNKTTLEKTPPEQVWARLQHRIAMQAEDTNKLNEIHRSNSNTYPETPVKNVGRRANGQGVSATAKPKQSWWWPTLTALSTMASLILGVLLSQSHLAPVDKLFRVSGVSLIVDNAAQPLWLVETDLSQNSVRVTALDPPSIDSSKDYQLWQVLPEGSGVNAVGLLPQENGLAQELIVDRPLEQRFSVYAVSVEPLGGSAKSTPSGPVLYQGDFVPVRQSIP